MLNFKGQSMFKQIMNTKPGISLAIIRIVLGCVLFAHGAQKMLGWFGGGGFTNTMNYFTGDGHMHYFTALFVILIEFFGSLMLIFGTLTRVAAFGVFGLFIGITYNFSLANGFFMNWGGDKKGEGFEYDILVLGMCFALLFAGGGSFSVDNKFSSK
jgi:putative oxidoreductase